MLALGHLSRASRRSCVATSRPRASAIPPRAACGRRRSLATWPGIHALLAHRVAHALHEAGVPLLPRRSPMLRARADRHRDPPSGADRRGPVHRPRLGRRDRRDGDDRRRRHALPGRDARRHRLRDGQAPPDGAGQRHDRLGREAARSDRRSATARRSAPTAWSSPTCRRTRRWSATPGTRSASTAAASRAPTPTGSTCPTRSPTRCAGSRQPHRRARARGRRAWVGAAAPRGRGHAAAAGPGAATPPGARDRTRRAQVGETTPGRRSGRNQ